MDVLGEWGSPCATLNFSHHATTSASEVLQNGLNEHREAQVQMD
jgi:hypothetical protein